MPAELHCHSLFSVDGWATPEELVEACAAAGITSLALTDHNSLDGLARARQTAETLGVRFFDGVEFDADWRGSEYHVVALGFDPGNVRLRHLCDRQFAQYALNFEPILRVLQRRYGVTPETLSAGLSGRYRTHPAPVLNKWFARGFLLGHGFFASEEVARREMPLIVAEAERGVTRPWVWADLGEVRDAVHGAGGIVLLAHVASYLRGDGAAQLALIHTMLELGLDGFELYHPSNLMEPHFADLVAEARRLDCAVSGGSDSHRDATRAVQAPDGFACPDWCLETIDAALARRRKAE